MYHVHTEDKWYAKAALLHCNTLQLGHTAGSLQVKKAAHPALANLFGHIARLCRSGDDVARHR